MRKSRRFGGRAARFAKQSQHAVMESLEQRQLLSATLVKDIAIGNLSSDPTQITDVNGNVFFTADNNDNPDQQDGGVDLFFWSSATKKAVDLKRLSNNFAGYPGTMMASFGGDLYFIAGDQYGDSILWKSDGTVAGTTQVAFLNVGNDLMTGLGGPVVFNNKLYFTNAGDLMVTDGTSAGTQAFMATGLTRGIDLVSMGGSLYFEGESSAGAQLWKSNGTVAGTTQVTSILATHGGFTDETGIVVSNGELYFSGVDGTANHDDIYKSNGTAAGTSVVGVYVNVQPMVSSNNLFYYDARLGSTYYVYRTDGTSGGTIQLHTLSVPSEPAIVAAGNEVFFIDGSLYVSNGTAAGTVVVPGAPANPIASSLAAVGTNAWFATAASIWKSNGTAVGTTLVSNLVLETPQEFTPTYIADIGGEAFFGAKGTNGLGTELWMSNGTSAGTLLAADVNTIPISSYPQGFVSLNGTLVFETQTGAWSTDGASAGTYALGYNGVGFPVLNVNGIGYAGYYGGQYESDFYVERTDGTAAGTFVAGQTNPGQVSGTQQFPPSDFTAVGNEVYFVVNDAVHDGDAIWKTNGTAGGTQFVTLTNGDPMNLFSLGGKLYYFAIDAGLGYQLYSTNGTAAGTSLVKLIDPTGSAINQNGTSVLVSGSTAYFAATDGTHGNELWKTNGTAAGTSMVADLNPGAGDSNPGRFIQVGSAVYFVTATVNQQSQTISTIWKTTGTSAGTTQVATSIVGGISQLAVLGTKLYFSSNSLYVMPIAGGTAISLGGNNVQELTPLGNLMYFSSGNGSFDLWQTDGTVANTKLVAGAFTSGTFSEMAVANGTLFFSVADATHGQELWEIAPTSVPAVPTTFKVASANSNSITLAFGDTHTDYNGYVLQRSTSSTFATISATVYLPAGLTSYVDTGLNPVTTTYYYRLTAINGKGQSAALIISAGKIAPPPAAPNTLVATVDSATQITLTWLEATAGVSYFTVQRSTSSTFATIDFTVTTTALTYIDKTTSPQVTYYYRVAAFIGSSGSAYTVTHATTPILPPVLPTNLSVSLYSGTSLTVLWDLGVGGGVVGTVNIERMLNNSGTWSAYGSTNLNNGNEFVDNNVSPGNTYSYRIEAVNAGGTSAYTAGVSYTIAPQSASLLKDIDPGTASSIPGYYAAVGADAYFVADDGVHGLQVWKTDGTTTTMLTDIVNPDKSGLGMASLTNVNGELYFVVEAGTTYGNQLWKSNGTTAGTSEVKLINTTGGPPWNLTAAGSLLFFSAVPNGGSNGVLWVSNGTSAGTISLGAYVAYTDEQNPTNIIAVGSSVYFSGAENGSPDGFELWTSNGTLAGTKAAVDLTPTFSTGNPGELTAVGSNIYFVAPASGGNNDLFVSNGTLAGTHLLKSYPDVFNITAVGSTAYFSANDGTNGYELWKSGGTAATTVMVENIAPGAASSGPGWMVDVNGTLFFQATDPTNGVGLWKSNGTAAGTVRLGSIIGSAVSLFQPSWALAFGNDYYFADGLNVFASDGTVGGIRWVVTTLGNYTPTQFGTYAAVAGGHLFFSADDDVHGIEPFVVSTPAPAAAIFADGKPVAFPADQSDLWDQLNGTSAAILS